MRQINRAFGAALATVALLGSTATSAQADPVADHLAAVDWKPCLEDAAVECGSLRLPIDYHSPGGPKFDMALARRKATDPAKRVGALLFNPGGPGDSGLRFLFRYPGYFSQELRSKFDIVGFDPRGVNRTQPVMCSMDVLNSEPTRYPSTQAEFDALAKYNRAVRDDCRERSGPIADNVGTDSTIQDMDAIREALGERKLTFYGVSYGTLMGQQYAERYGDKVRSMVLDSNMDHSLGPWAYAEDAARTVQSSFDEWVKWCDRSTSCALHGQDVKKFWHSVLAKGDRRELPDNLTARDVIRQTFNTLFGPRWTQLATYLVELNKGVNIFPEPPTQDKVVNSVYKAVICSDWSMPMRTLDEYKALERMENSLAPDMRGGTFGHGMVTHCIGLSEKVDNPQHKLNITNAPKILMLNAMYDPSTPHAWAVNAHNQTKDKTVLLTYEGWGHGVYGRSDCTTAPVDEYLVSTKIPSVRRCGAVEPPVGPNSLRNQQ